MSAAKGKAPTALTVEALDETQSTNKGNHVNNFNASTPSLTKAKPLTTVTTTGTTALVFESTTFNVVTRDNQPWLRGNQIASALGYSDASSINRIYARQSSEFTDGMTGSVKLTDPQGELQETRIFSLRGAHLLGMFARTDKAALFRKWVLDILDAHVAQLNHSVTDTLIPSEQQTLSELVHRRVAGADSALQGKALAEIWSRLHRKFRVAKYNQLPRTQLSDAIAYVMGMQVKALAGASTTPPHVNERLSGADLQNIKRMIYNASRGFQFQGSWNQAVWFYLRLALNLPSPQPFGVDHLPRLAHELQRVNAITSQVQDVIYEIEAQAAKRLFRKVESVDVVMADLRRLAAERMAQLKDDADRLPNYMKSDIAAIVNRTETGYWGHLSNDEQPGYFDHYNSEGAFA